MNKQIIILLLIVSLLFVGCDNSSSTFDETSSQIEKDTLEETTGKETTSEEDPPEDTTDEETTDEETTGEKKKPVGNIKDFDMESYERNIYDAVVTYYCSTNLCFEEGDKVKIDDLMLYYSTSEIRDDKGELKESLREYATGNSFYEISIPKEIVHKAIEEHYAVQIDASYSKYTDPSNDGNYLIDAYARGYADVLMKDVTVEGNRITGTFMYADFRLDIVYYVREICFEMIDETDFRYVYAKDLFTISEEEMNTIIWG